MRFDDQHAKSSLWPRSLKGALPVTIGGPCVGLLCEEETEEDMEIARQIFAKRQVEVELQYTRSKEALAGQAKSD